MWYISQFNEAKGLKSGGDAVICKLIDCCSINRLTQPVYMLQQYKQNVPRT